MGKTALFESLPMDLHALTSKSEISEKPPETSEAVTSLEPVPEPASPPLPMAEPVLTSVPDQGEKEISLEPVVFIPSPEPLAIPLQPGAKGEEAMTTESNTTSKQNIHDSTFWEVHFIVVYYILLIALAAWLLLNVWGGDLMVLKQLGLTEKAIADPFLRTVGYTIVGSVFGSVLYNIRVLFYWYLRARNYDPRWLGKYISAPWESAAMSVVVLALVRGGAALFGGGAAGTVAAPPTPMNNFASFGMGALVGFGMRDVVRWVQALVETTFGALTKEKTPSTKEQPEGEG